MFISKAKAVLIAQEVVRIHAPRILKKLGLHDHDGIVERITTPVESTVYDQWGACMVEHPVPNINNHFIVDRAVLTEYVRSNAYIHIYPLAMRYTNEWGYTLPTKMMFSKKKFTAWCILTLAHELRHYWQFYTGEYWKHHALPFGESVIPYHMRWCETDAVGYSLEYLREVIEDDVRVLL